MYMAEVRFSGAECAAFARRHLVGITTLQVCDCVLTRVYGLLRKGDLDLLCFVYASHRSQSESVAVVYPASLVELVAPGHQGIRASGANRVRTVFSTNAVIGFAPDGGPTALPWMRCSPSTPSDVIYSWLRQPVGSERVLRRCTLHEVTVKAAIVIPDSPGYTRHLVGQRYCCFVEVTRTCALE
jgi:hypothetical protein